MDWEAAKIELGKKLDPKNVQPPKKFGPKGSYIEGWFAMAEANRIFGFGAWSYTVTECKCVSERAREVGQNKNPGFGVTYTATVRVAIGDVVREDVGAGHGYDVDCGLAHESAIKEAVTDSLKRALRGFSNPFGLALYDKSRENVGVDGEPSEARKPASRQAAPSDLDQKVSHNLLAAVRQHGPGVATDPAFARDLAALRKNAPELAAQVDAEIETKQQGKAA